MNTNIIDAFDNVVNTLSNAGQRLDFAAAVAVREQPYAPVGPVALGALLVMVAVGAAQAREAGIKNLMAASAAKAEAAAAKKADAALLASAKSEALAWAKSIEERNDWKTGPARKELQGIMEEMAALVISGRAARPGQIENLRARASTAQAECNYRRAFVGLAPLGKAEMQDLYEKALAAVAKAEEQEAATYAASCSFTQDDWAEDRFEIEKAESTADFATRTDKEWSERARARFQDETDPSGAGFMTRGLERHGGNIYNTLAWMYGKGGKAGFVSDPRFTKRDRALLVDFKCRTWDHLKGRPQPRPWELELDF